MQHVSLNSSGPYAPVPKFRNRDVFYILGYSWESSCIKQNSETVLPLLDTFRIMHNTVKSKVISLQARCGPEGR